MNSVEILALFDKEQRREIEFPDMRKESTAAVVRFVRDSPGKSFVLYSELDEWTADAAIDEQIAYFRRHGQSFEWKAYAHDRPANLVQRLADRGFKTEEADAVMVLDVRSAPSALLAQPVVEVRRIVRREQLADVVAILTGVWGGDFDWVYERLGSHLSIPGYLSVYVAYVDLLPVSVGWTYFNAGHFAGLWGGSTLGEYRGRGLYTALLAARVQEAHRRGVAYLTVDAGRMSQPILARYGFTTLTLATDCEWAPEELTTQ